MKDLPNIDYKKTSQNPTLDSDTSLYMLPYYKDVEYFSNLDNFVGFIKGVESLVRTSKYYSRYVKWTLNYTNQSIENKTIQCTCIFTYIT